MIGSHGELDERSRREVSNQIDVQNFEKLDSIVGRVFEAIYMFAEVIASFRWENVSPVQHCCRS